MSGDNSTAVVLALISGVFAIASLFVGPIITARIAERKAVREVRVKAAEDADAAKRPLRPGSFEAMNDRFDRQDQRIEDQDAIIRALAGVLMEVADQWQGDHPPRISKGYLDALSKRNFIPAGWQPADGSA